MLWEIIVIGVVIVGTTLYFMIRSVGDQPMHSAREMTEDDLRPAFAEAWAKLEPEFEALGFHHDDGLTIEQMGLFLVGQRWLSADGGTAVLVLLLAMGKKSVDVGLEVLSVFAPSGYVQCYNAGVVWRHAKRDDRLSFFLAGETDLKIILRHVGVAARVARESGRVPLDLRRASAVEWQNWFEEVAARDVIRQGHGRVISPTHYRLTCKGLLARAGCLLISTLRAVGLDRTFWTPQKIAARARASYFTPWEELIYDPATMPPWPSDQLIPEADAPVKPV